MDQYKGKGVVAKVGREKTGKVANVDQAWVRRNAVPASQANELAIAAHDRIRAEMQPSKPAKPAAPPVREELRDVYGRTAGGKKHLTPDNASKSREPERRHLDPSHQTPKTGGERKHNPKAASSVGVKDSLKDKPRYPVSEAKPNAFLKDASKERRHGSANHASAPKIPERRHLDPSHETPKTDGERKHNSKDASSAAVRDSLQDKPRYPVAEANPDAFGRSATGGKKHGRPNPNHASTPTAPQMRHFREPAANKRNIAEITQKTAKVDPRAYFKEKTPVDQFEQGGGLATSRGPKPDVVVRGSSNANGTNQNNVPKSY